MLLWRMKPFKKYTYHKFERMKPMKPIKMSNGKSIPLEMHKARIVQKCSLISPVNRLQAITEAGNNTFLLNNRDVFLDMLTDSGVNAMSDNQLAAMMKGDDSYAGSETFHRLEEAVSQLFGTQFFLPTHQGRASEHLISKCLISPGKIVPMNYHFTTSKAHITILGGEIVELYSKDALDIRSQCPFKGNMDIEALDDLILKFGKENIGFVRMEAGTNLIGGQPFSLENLRQVSIRCRMHQIPLVLDASLLSDNLHFIKMREDACREMSIQEIAQRMASLCDIIYFSGRKLGAARGGGICTSNEAIFKQLRPMIPLYEGFLTYGGMSIKEMEAMAIGLNETLDEDNISQGPQFIAFMTEAFIERGVPVITPPGGLGCHLDAMAFLPHVQQEKYPAGALAAAIYLVSGIRGMERGTLSEQRNTDGTEPLAHMELVRLALPRRVFTMSHILFAVDRIAWLFQNRHLIGGLEWVEEPDVLRFFYGRLNPDGNWQKSLMEQFEKDFGDSH